MSKKMRGATMSAETILLGLFIAGIAFVLGMMTGLNAQEGEDI